jgi:glycine oxidase
MAQKVVVVGAGVIGLATARALATRGASVVVVDGSTGSREASWAAAGILGVGTENQADGPLFRFALAAHRRWPSLVAELEAETGVDLRYRTEGTLLVALETGDVPPLDARLALLPAHGIDARRLEGDEARRLEPRLSPSILSALWIPEAWLDNRHLWQAYEISCRHRGIPRHTNEAVLEVLERGGRAAGVRTPTETIAADAVVIAAGAWSEDLARASGLSLPMTPVKGQLVRLAAPDGWLTRIVKRGIHYLVPQVAHGLVVGTTAEEVGFDRGLHEEALDGIVAGVTRLVPEAAGLPRIEAWAGFRPRLPDLLPAIGAVAGRPGLVVATGHYRNGILLCEVTGQAAAAAVFGEPDPFGGLGAAFDPARFGAPTRRA